MSNLQKIVVLCVIGAGVVTFLVLQQGNVPIEADFGTKIIYGTHSSELGSLEADCNQRGGTFDSCGTLCSPDEEVCPFAMCAIICENIPVEDSDPN